MATPGSAVKSTGWLHEPVPFQSVTVTVLPFCSRGLAAGAAAARGSAGATAACGLALRGSTGACAYASDKTVRALNISLALPSSMDGFWKRKMLLTLKRIL